MVKTKEKKEIGIVRMKDFENELARINKERRRTSRRTCGILKISDEFEEESADRD
jgi:hypothetical protein